MPKQGALATEFLTGGIPSPNAPDDGGDFTLSGFEFVYFAPALGVPPTLSQMDAAEADTVVVNGRTYSQWLGFRATRDFQNAETRKRAALAALTA
jgi:hypothetical protein